MTKLAGIIDKVNDSIGKFLSFGLIVIMVIMAIEVVCRYVFDSPTTWAWPINGLLFAALLFLGGGYVLLHKGHVRLDILYERFSPRGQLIADIVTFPVFLIFLSIAVWQGWVMASSSVAMREAVAEYFHAPEYPTRVAFLVAAILLLLQGLAIFVRNIISLRERNKQDLPRVLVPVLALILILALASGLLSFSVPSPLIATLLIIVCVFALFAAGLPIVFCLGGTATIFLLLFFSKPQWYLMATSMYGTARSEILIAVPLFILMGGVIVYTGIAEDMFAAIYKWAGPVRGALAMGSEVIGAAFGAMCAGSSAATLTLGTIALPQMLNRRYDKHLAIGSVCTAGLLGILIPPTVIGIIYCCVSGLSVGKLYSGLFIPGFLLAGIYILYIGIRCYFQPLLAPALPKEERASWKEKFVSLRGVILPALIILAVLGGMYSGIVTPTEASGAGAIAVMLAALARRRLNWESFKDSCALAFRLSSMVIWIMMAITVFSNVYHSSGASKIIQQLALSLPISGFGVIVLMQLTIFLLGCVMDDVVIIMVCTPIYLPIVTALGFDPLWFGVLFLININIAWLTPPYGFNLFYMRAITPKEITMMDIYLSVPPFVACQLVCLLLVMFFPQVALWLPSVIITR